MSRCVRLLWCSSNCSAREISDRRGKKNLRAAGCFKQRHPHSVSKSSSSITATAVLPDPPTKMASINYLLYESAAGYAVFQVVNQADSVGLQLKEVQNSLQNLATFSKHVKLVNFTPYR